MSRDFCTALGFEVFEDEAGKATGRRVRQHPGEVPAATVRISPVILNAHMDTVGPGSGVAPSRMRTVSRAGRHRAGRRLQGGRRGDPGGGRSLWQALRVRTGRSSWSSPSRRRQGLIGAKHLDFSMLDGRWGVVLDGSGPVGGIVVEAPGQDQVEFTVRGRSAPTRA